MATVNSHDALSFFILEASECLERLDTALGRATAAGPASDEFVGAARTLRGSATMHRVAGMAELAQSVERVGRALRDKSVSWTPALASAMIGAVDDLKLLLHSVRSWGASEDARVARRRADLARMVPGIADSTPTTPAPPAASAPHRPVPRRRWRSTQRCGRADQRNRASSTAAPLRRAERVSASA